MANALKYLVYAGDAGGQWKGSSMWIFDGEEWTEEGATQSERKPESSLPMWEETMPELQVIEHIPSPVTRTNYDVPPLPLP